jgi:WXG100 family type VII secretion target
VAGFTVDRSAMQAVAGEMDNANRQIDAEMNWLISQLSALPGLWKGDAATSFYNAKASWDTLAQAHNQRLVQISQGLMHTQGNYGSAEKANESSVNSISEALNG